MDLHLLLFKTNGMCREDRENLVEAAQRPINKDRYRRTKVLRRYVKFQLHRKVPLVKETSLEEEPMVFLRTFWKTIEKPSKLILVIQRELKLRMILVTISKGLL
jgi:hypothetical protein